MTPPETPDRQGTEPDKNGDRSSVMSMPNGADSADEKAGASAGQAANGDNGTPPPWQRMPESSVPAAAEAAAGDTPDAAAANGTAGQSADPDEPTKSDKPASRNDVDTKPEPAGEQTVSVPRPVQPGATPPRMFDEKTVSIPNPLTAKPGADAGARTSVNLGAVTGGARSAGSAPPSALRRPGRGPRRASLQIKRFDPWSVLKLSLVLGVALFFVWLVAVGALYAVLEGMGVWDKLNGTYNELLQGGADGASAEPLISAGRVFGVAAIIGAVNIVLFSALATVGAFVYNVSADLAGGLEVTLAERE